MSDFDSDIDDELLELAGAGATEKKRRKRQAPSGSSKVSTSKKRKADASSEEEDHAEAGAESEDGEEDPYPLEGKYVNETDRQQLMQMSEIDREGIVAQRLEEKQKLKDKRMISQMVKKQRGGDTDSVSKAAKRQHAVRGATKEKSRKLDELKARRKAKDEKRRNNSPKRDRSSSPMDMEISDDEEEDGQISKLEQAEEREKKLLPKAIPDDEPVTMDDLEKCRLTRDMLVKYCLAPWFEDYVHGAWVRYLIGMEDGQPVYRICEVANLSADLVKPYVVDGKTLNQAFDLKHGKSVRSFSMDKVSNGPFQEREFDRWVRSCAVDEVKLPSKRQLEKKLGILDKLVSQPMTENDIKAILDRKNQLQAHKPQGLSTLERSRLNQARTLAQRRHDYAEVAEIDAQLAVYNATGSNDRRNGRQEDVDMLAKVNERNRKANLEAVRKAELMEADRKRRERKLAAAGGAVAPQDPSARLKIMPRLFNAATPSSRPGTPSGVGTPPLHVQPAAGSRPVSPLPPSKSGSKTFEAAIIDSIEVDLGDF
ncbi:hypothetical protein BD779DRAFT_1565326 [Infundibulicybe gibba]|nr:hypothetical protein BD779DRAFT_1565326 [Infundibulicybe gibba]